MQGFKATAPVPCRTAGTKPSPHRTTRMVQLLGAAPRSRHRPASRHRMCNAGAGNECASRRSATARQRPNHPDSTLRLTDGPQDALEDVTLVIFRQRQAKVSAMSSIAAFAISSSERGGGFAMPDCRPMARKAQAERSVNIVDNLRGYHCISRAAAWKPKQRHPPANKLPIPNSAHQLSAANDPAAPGAFLWSCLWPR